jgi:hypothetical protein
MRTSSSQPLKGYIEFPPKMMGAATDAVDCRTGGTWEPDGQLGDGAFTFKNGAYSYDVSETANCSGQNDDCEPRLSVSKGTLVLSSEVCRHHR